MSLLQVSDLRVSYGPIAAVHGVTMMVAAGQMVGVVGRNGAGKSTVMRAISGLHRASGGSIMFDGKRIDQLHAHDVVKLGIAYVPEGRRVFSEMSVIDNLRIGAFSVGGQKRQATTNERLEQAFAMFPILRERSGQLAGTLSGGQQQMLAIARALMSGPRLLLLDEPSMGLAPIVVNDLFASIRALHARGLTIVIVEQKALQTLRMVDQAHVLSQGRITISGTGQELLANPEVRAAYLGQSQQTVTAPARAAPTQGSVDTSRSAPSIEMEPPMMPSRQEQPEDATPSDDGPIGRPTPLGAPRQPQAPQAVPESSPPAVVRKPGDVGEEERPVGAPRPVGEHPYAARQTVPAAGAQAQRPGGIGLSPEARMQLRHRRRTR